MTNSVFSKPLETAIGQTYKRARELRHEYMGVEDLLLGLLDFDEVKSAIESANGDLAKLKSDLVRHITTTAKVLSPEDGRDTQPTLGFQRALQRAVYHVQSSGLNEVTPLRVLIALYGEKDSFAKKALEDQDVHRLDILNFLTRGDIKSSPPSGEEKIERIKASPSEPKPSDDKLKVFISYAHSDAKVLDRLRVHLKPLEKQSRIVAWSDQNIRAGGKWKEEIAKNIDHAAVAVLLVSADFLASDFIVDHELPPLLLKAEADGTRIIPVIVKPCGFTRQEALSSFQALNDPKHPLLALSEMDQERLYDQIAMEIYKELSERKTK